MHQIFIKKSVENPERKMQPGGRIFIKLELADKIFGLRLSNFTKICSPILETLLRTHTQTDRQTGEAEII
jgi:hypothetical protein